MFTLDRDGGCFTLKCDGVVVARDLTRSEGIDLMKKLVLAETNKFKGEKGDVGAKGEKGDAGAKGDKGDAGDKGDKGDAGDKGEKGDAGDKGNAGEKGDAGKNGVDGKHGVDGKDGKNGRAIVEVGTTQPSHGAIGALWFDTTVMKLKVCLGSQWV